MFFNQNNNLHRIWHTTCTFVKPYLRKSNISHKSIFTVLWSRKKVHLFTCVLMQTLSLTSLRIAPAYDEAFSECNMMVFVDHSTSQKLTTRFGIIQCQGQIVSWHIWMWHVMEYPIENACLIIKTYLCRTTQINNAHIISSYKPRDKLSKFSSKCFRIRT